MQEVRNCLKRVSCFLLLSTTVISETKSHITILFKTFHLGSGKTLVSFFIRSLKTNKWGVVKTGDLQSPLEVNMDVLDVMDASMSGEVSAHWDVFGIYDVLSEVPKKVCLKTSVFSVGLQAWKNKAHKWASLFFWLSGDVCVSGA